MHLIEYTNYEIVPTEEAFLIKPIRDLYNEDKTKNKEKFMQQLSILYFIADPRSSYSYILDEEERFKEILKQEGLPENFKISKKLQEAIDIYKKHTITASYLLLQDNKEVIENMRRVLKSIDWDGLEEKDKVNAVKTVASITSMIPKIVKDLAEAEKAVTKELEDLGRARGGNEAKSLFEDGINFS